jgi:3-amino-5-hydroxybenzoate synthase
MHDELAINGGSPAKTRPFPEWPQYDQGELAAVQRVIESRQWWRIVGPETSSFEREFAAYQGAGHALAVTNGTQAIELALMALGIGRGHEVIVPAFTFVSTALGVLNVNAVPIPVDVDPDTYCIDPAAVEAAITPRTRAILPVHMAGHAADMDALLDIARRHDLVLLEDAAHAQGTAWRGRRVGAFGQGSIFSFQAGKLMTAGEGGLILSDDADFIERCFLFSSCGRPKTDRSYQHALLGSNARMPELLSAVLRVQLTRLEDQIARREQNAPLLDALLRAIPGIVPQRHDPRVTRHPHYMYMFTYDSAAFGGLPRQELVDLLIAEGIPAFVGYPAIQCTPVFQQRAFAPRWDPNDPLLPDYRAIRTPVSESIGEQVVWLHHRVLLGDEQDLHEIAGALRKIQLHTQTAGRLS